MKKPIAALLGVTLGWPVSAHAIDEAQLRQAITAHLTRQAAELPGAVDFEIGVIASPGMLASCAQVRIEPDPGARPWGATRVRAVCVEGAQWSMLVPVKISVVATYLVASRPLAPGTTLTDADLATRHGRIDNLPGDLLLDRNAAVGNSTRSLIAGGATLRRAHLRSAIVVRAGQSVRVSSRGAGFEVSSQGEALVSAEAGEPVRVRLSGGRVISGKARADGSVEIAN